MNVKRKHFHGAGLLRWLLATVGACLVALGCARMPVMESAPLGPMELLPPKAGSRAEAQAFKQKVRNDSFPDANEEGL